MGGWMAQCAELLGPLYQASKKELFGSKVIGTDDTSVKVLEFLRLPVDSISTRVTCSLGSAGITPIPRYYGAVRP